jgi:hypothetical protein
MGIPITPNISHTAKQTTNAQVLTPKTMMLLRLDMLPPPERTDRSTMRVPLGLRESTSRHSIRRFKADQRQELEKLL